MLYILTPPVTVLSFCQSTQALYCPYVWCLARPCLYNIPNPSHHLTALNTSLPISRETLSKRHPAERWCGISQVSFLSLLSQKGLLQLSMSYCTPKTALLCFMSNIVFTLWACKSMAKRCAKSPQVLPRLSSTPPIFKVLYTCNISTQHLF